MLSCWARPGKDPGESKEVSLGLLQPAKPMVDVFMEAGVRLLRVWAGGAQTLGER